MQYRRDIDGLRAVAVVPVVIFHIAQSFARGGYVGVDIFFVISGYLISANIFREIDKGTFSIASFYERRVRRIAPAYLVMLLFTAAVVIWKFYPSETKSYSEAFLASIASVTNIYFWATTGYFALAAEEIPLLHTWSLSVEEQFYLIFPLIFIFLAKSKIFGIKSSLIILALFSLVLSAVGAFTYPSATFYLLPTRAWELLLGTLLAVRAVPALQTDMQRNVVSVTGLAMIAASMVFYTPDMAFPGLAALPPCLGAAMIIHAGENGNNIVARILSLRPVVFIGLISYSLYLWHWPLMVFQRTTFLLIETDSKFLVRFTVLVASFVAATLSWWLIERPTRNRTLVPTRLLVGTVGVVVGLSVVLAAGMKLTNGLPQRFSTEAVRLAGFAGGDETPRFRSGECFLPAEDSIAVFDKASCLPNVAGKKSVMLLGDSHAAMLYKGMSEVLPNENVLQVTGVKCAPLVETQVNPGIACKDLLKIAVDEVPQTHKDLTVLLAARWNTGEVRPTTGWKSTWLQNLKETVDVFRAKGAKVYIIGQMPEYQVALPRLLAASVEKNDPQLPRRLISGPSLELDTVMREFAKKNNLSYVSLRDIVCPNDLCKTYAEPGIPLMFDNSHVTEEGSKLLATEIAKKIGF